MAHPWGIEVSAIKWKSLIFKRFCTIQFLFILNAMVRWPLVMPKPFRPRKKGKQPSKSLYTPAYEKIRELLRETRHTAQLSQEELGERLGRKQIYVSRCESGERRVDLLEWLEVMLACKADPCVFISAVLPLVKIPRDDAEQNSI